MNSDSDSEKSGWGEILSGIPTPEKSAGATGDGEPGATVNDLQSDSDSPPAPNPKSGAAADSETETDREVFRCGQLLIEIIGASGPHFLVTIKRRGKFLASIHSLLGKTLMARLAGVAPGEEFAVAILGPGRASLHSVADDAGLPSQLYPAGRGMVETLTPTSN